MDCYMYKSICPRWWGITVNVNHIVVKENTPENDVIEQAKLTSNALSGSKTCDINLIQKYHMIIEPKTTYPAMTQLIHGNDN